MKFICALTLLALVSLAACATSEGSAEVTFQTARVSANAYEALALCGSGNVSPCAEKTVVQRIHDASETAYNALLIARKTQNGSDIDVANQAVTAFEAVINLPEVQTALLKKGQ